MVNEAQTRRIKMANTETQRCNFTSIKGVNCEEGVFVNDAMTCELCNEEVCPSHIRGMQAPDYDGWTCDACIANFVINEPTKHVHVYPLNANVFTCTTDGGAS
jgi:hypothetical protein